MNSPWVPIFAMQQDISQIQHPDYKSQIMDWVRYRFTFEGGRPFIRKYLKKFSKREEQSDYNNREDITYCPAHAKAAIMDIKNAIYQRMVDISREGGPGNYLKAVAGEIRGVDLQGNSMNGFVGRLLLPELLSMAKVGVYIDKFPQEAGTSVLESSRNRPYLYMYKTEDIRSWSVDQEGNFQSLLLRDTIDVEDPITGLVIDQVTQFRLLKLVEEGVEVKFYAKNGKEIPNSTKMLALNRIPFVLFELSQSLLTDVADYQIALLNMGSSDINYSLKSNYPFYTEQFDAASELAFVRQATTSETGDASDTKPGEANEAATAKNREIKTGAAAGRRYPKGLDRPDFIHPSSEPLMASMQKQSELREEIRQLVNLNVSDLKPVRASAESKQEDSRGLEAGLSYIGLELEYGERQIGEIWSLYEGAAESQIQISYPTSYSLRTDKDRREESKELREELPNLPSKTYQQEIAKQIATIMLHGKVPSDKLKKVYKEIESSPVIVTDPEVIVTDHEAGFVSTAMASTLRGYPADQVEQAKKDHADRAARIALAQSQAAARGVADMDADPQSGEREKEASRNNDLESDVRDRTRGEGQ